MSKQQEQRNGIRDAIRELPFRLSTWSRRHPWIALGLTGTLSLIALLLTARLELKNDFAALLPPKLPAVKSLRQTLDRMGGVGHQAVMISSPDANQNRTFLKALRKELNTLFWSPDKPAAEDAQRSFQRLNSLHRDIFYYARQPTPLLRHKLAQRIQHVDKASMVIYAFTGYDRSFFKKHRLLYLSVDDLKGLKTRIQTRLRYENKRRQPGYIDLLGENPPSLGLKTLSQKYSTRYQRFPERIEVKEGKTNFAALIIRPQGTPTDMAFCRTFVAKLKAATKALQKRYNRGIHVEYVGGFAANLQEFGGIARDLRFSTILTMCLLALLLLTYFRRFRALPLIFVSLGAGTLWMLAFAQLSIGYLNTVTGFVGALLLGFGIDYGIYLLSRYFEERRRGLDINTAMDETFRWTGRAIFTASVTSAVAFFALLVCGFRAFSQFGLLGGMGIILCLFAMFTVFPAMLQLTEDRKPMTPPQPLFQKKEKGRNLAQPPRRLAFATTLVLASVLIISGGLFSVTHIPFETDVRKLSFQDKGLVYSSNLWKRFESQFPLGQMNPLVMWAPDASASRALHQELDKRAKRASKGLSSKAPKPIAGILSATHFVPKAQKAKLKELNEIKGLLSRYDVNALVSEPKLRKDLAQAQRWLAVSGITVADLPLYLQKSLLFYKRDQIDSKPQHLVLVSSGYNMSNGAETRKLYALLRGISWQGLTFEPAGESLILAEIMRMIERDSVLAIIACLLAMFFLVFIDLRDLRLTLLALWPLATGILGLLVLLAHFQIPLNIYNLLVLPALMGLGIDGGVHILHSYQENPKQGARGVQSRMFAPLLLASLTTVISFSAMTSAHHMGIRSIGIVATLGLATCLFGSLVFLPALIQRFLTKGDHVPDSNNDSLDIGLNTGQQQRIHSRP